MAVVATLSKGYDLASENGAEAPGRWWGPGAKALGLEPGQVVECEPCDLLFGQRTAPDGTPLGRPPATAQNRRLYAQLLAAEPHATAERRHELRVDATRQARQGPLFFDLTISLSKSISIFRASRGENVRLARDAGDLAGERYWSALVAEVDEMIWQAVRAGLTTSSERLATPAAWVAAFLAARVIETEIRSGQWKPGNAIPSRNQPAERFGIARETAARAHAWLARTGYLVVVPGVGMVVTPTNRWPKEAT